MSIASLLAGGFAAHAQTDLNDPVAAREAQLKAELAQVEAEIAQNQAYLNQKKGESASLSRDIAILDSQIKAAQLQIKAKTISIARLGKDIDKKTETIGTLSGRIEQGKESLAQILRKTNEMDSFSTVEVVLSNQDLSSFFEDLDAFDSIERSMQVTFAELQSAKEQNEAEKHTLHTKRTAETDAKAEIEREERIIRQKEAEKAALLKASKNQEKNYQAIVNDRQKKAASIRAALFALRDTKAIPFGDALSYANSAGRATGVRPALILAILKQESNLGQNVGQCYLTDPATGSGVGKNTGTPFANVMKVGRDVEPFMALAQQLGFEPFRTAVSCPIGGVGYGGAMGPSQFIASTWTSYSSRIAAAVGESVANPWVPKHAFTATALYLADLGASAGGRSAEYEAAGRYYAGSGWATRGASYANSVLNIAADIQTNMIDPLQGL